MVLLYNPRQMVFVTCRGTITLVGREQEREFIIPTAWHSPMSQHPAMYGVVLPSFREHAITAIRSEGRFVVNFMAESAKKAAVLLSDHKTAFDEPFSTANLTRVEAQQVPCPRIDEAVGWAECEVHQEIKVGDHILFVGRILHADLPDKKSKRLFHVQEDEFTTTE